MWGLEGRSLDGPEEGDGVFCLLGLSETHYNESGVEKKIVDRIRDSKGALWVTGLGFDRPEVSPKGWAVWSPGGRRSTLTPIPLRRFPVFHLAETPGFPETPLMS